MKLKNREPRQKPVTFTVAIAMLNKIAAERGLTKEQLITLACYIAPDKRQQS